MKVCVFGASGYVGASVYKQLQGMPNIELAGTYLDHPVGFENLEQLDINQPESFSAFYKKEQPDVIIWSVMSGPDEHELTNQGLMHMLTHITPETKLVYISSDLVFGVGEGPYMEDDPISGLPDDHIYSNYTNAKVKAERLIDQELSNYTILRAGPIYGKNDIGIPDEHTEQLTAKLSVNQPVYYRNDLIRTFVHIEDLTNVIVEMAENEVKGIYHTGPDKQQSYYQFMLGMAEQLGYNPSFIEKEVEQEKADQEIPKNISLNTEKIKTVTKQTFR